MEQNVKLQQTRARIGFASMEPLATNWGSSMWSARAHPASQDSTARLLLTSVTPILVKIMGPVKAMRPLSRAHALMVSNFYYSNKNTSIIDKHREIPHRYLKYSALSDQFLPVCS